ncbi:MAG: hypothetical protein ACYDC2_08400 [Solirubrobacteraceae bacterium]
MATAREQARAARQIEDLLAEARHARERYHLYRARMYGLRPTTMSRLRELERVHHGAESRLRRAQAELASLRQADGASPDSAQPPAPHESEAPESL